MWSGRRSGPMPPPAWPPWQPAQFIATNSCRPCSSAEGSLAYGFCIVVAGSSPSTCGPATVCAAPGGDAAAEGGGADAEQPLMASNVSPASIISINLSVTDGLRCTATNGRGCLKSKDIQHASRARVLLEVGYRPDRAEGRGRIGFRHARQRGGGKPSADAGVHGDVLLAVRPDKRHRLTHDSRARLELPEHLAGACINGAKPAVERAVEHEIAAGREHPAEERQLRLLER